MVGKYHQRLAEIIRILEPFPNLQALFSQQQEQLYYIPAISINHLKQSLETLKELQYIFEVMQQAANHHRNNFDHRAREISNSCFCSKLNIDPFTSTEFQETMKRRQQREQKKKRKRQFNQCCIRIQIQHNRLFNEHNKLQKINKQQTTKIISLSHQCQELRLKKKEPQDATHQRNNRCQQLISQRQTHINKIYNQDREIMTLKFQLEKFQPEDLMPRQDKDHYDLILCQLKALNEKVEVLEKYGQQKQHKVDEILDKISSFQPSSSKLTYKKKQQNLQLSSSCIQYPIQINHPINNTYQQIQEIQSDSEIMIPSPKNVSQSIKNLTNINQSQLKTKLQNLQTQYQ